jgi:hypothetical protein
MHFFDANPRKAAMKYESLRRRLVRMFRAWGHVACEDLADRAIDRVVRKLDRGLTLWPGDRHGYFFRVAYFISLEDLRQNARAKRALKRLQEQGSSSEELDGQERRLAILEAHVGSLSADERRLLLRYYEGDGQTRIQNRRLLAAEHGMTLNTLRVCVHRIRAGLDRALAEEDEADALRSIV